MKYKCTECGEERFFYNEVSVAAKRIIDLKEGVRNGKIFDVDEGNVDNDFETVYCYECQAEVEELGEEA